MAGWTLDDIPWQAFDRARVDPAIVPVIKAASMVEANAADYRSYLLNVFHDDPRVRTAIDGWAVEEVRHGMALRCVAESGDDELCFAFHAANRGDAPYDRRQCARAYARATLGYIGADHVKNAIGLMLTAVGLDGAGALGRVAAAVAWRAVRLRRGWQAHRVGA